MNPDARFQAWLDWLLKWENLRVATRGQNASNKGKQRNNTSGVRGVTWCKRTKKWMAQIGLNGRCLFLGRFFEISEAQAAREMAARHHHGEFSLHAQATQ